MGVAVSKEGKNFSPGISMTCTLPTAPRHGLPRPGTRPAMKNPSGCSSSARRYRMKAVRCRRPDLSWVGGMPLLNCLATGLDPVCSWLSTVWITWRCGFDSREKPGGACTAIRWGESPPPRHTGAMAQSPGSAARDTVPSAGGLRTVRASGNCVRPSTARTVRRALRSQRQEAPPNRASAALQPLATARPAACPFEGLDSLPRTKRRNERKAK